MTANRIAHHFEQRAARLDAALRIIAEKYSISSAELKSAETQEQHFIPRAIAAYVLTEVLKFSFKDVQTELRMTAWDVGQALKQIPSREQKDEMLQSILSVFRSGMWLKTVAAPSEHAPDAPTQSPDADAVEKTLSPTTKQRDPEIDLLIQMILESVWQTLNVNLVAMRSRIREPFVVRARTTTVFLMKHLCDIQHSEIAEILEKVPVTSQLQYRDAKLAMTGSDMILRHEIVQVSEHLLGNIEAMEARLAS